MTVSRTRSRPSCALEALLEDAEVVGDAQAEVRQRAARVDEVDGDDLAAQVGERDRPALLIGQCEVRHRLADGQRARWPSPAGDLVEQLQAAGGQGDPARRSGSARRGCARRATSSASTTSMNSTDGARHQAVEVLRSAHLERHGHRAHEAGIAWIEAVKRRCGHDPRFSTMPRDGVLFRGAGQRRAPTRAPAAARASRENDASFGLPRRPQRNGRRSIAV